MSNNRFVGERLLGAPFSVVKSGFALGWVMILCGVLGCGPGSDIDISAGDVVATFDGGEVTRTELLASGSSVEPGNQADPGVLSTDWRIEKIKDLAFRRILVSEVPDGSTLEQQIGQQRAVALVEMMEEQLGWNGLTVSEDQVRRQFDMHPEQYRDPEKIRLQHIFLAAEAGETADEERRVIRAKLEAIRVQLTDGADFTAMVRQYSQSSTAGRGGWLGLDRGKAVDHNFTEAAWSLELNEISEIVDTPHGYHVLVVRERHPPLQRQYEDVREFALKRAKAAKRADVQRLFVEEMAPQYGLAKNFEPLSDPFAQDDAALISAGDYRFTVADLGRELPTQYMEQLFNGYFPKVHEFLDRVALNRLLVLEAERLGLFDDPAMVEVVEAITEEVRFQAALGIRLQDKVAAVPESAMREYFQQNHKRYQTLRGTDLSLIFLPPGDNLWTTLDQGRELVRRIRTGESFEELAREYSHHVSARDGGLLRGLNDYQIAAQVQSGARFRRAFDALKDGEVAEAMVAECYDPDTLRFIPTGVLVFRRDHVTEPVAQPYEVAEPFVRGNYLRRNHQHLVDEIRAEVIDQIDLEIHVENLPGV